MLRVTDILLNQAVLFGWAAPKWACKHTADDSESDLLSTVTTNEHDATPGFQKILTCPWQIKIMTCLENLSDDFLVKKKYTFLWSQDIKKNELTNHPCSF